MFGWSDLSGSEKATLIGAIVAALLASLPKVRKLVIRAFCIRTLEKLEAAREQIRGEADAVVHMRFGGPIDTDTNSPSIPLERLAQKAAIPLWRARYATRWNERRKKYGPF